MFWFVMKVILTSSDHLCWKLSCDDSEVKDGLTETVPPLNISICNLSGGYGKCFDYIVGIFLILW